MFSFGRCTCRLGRHASTRRRRVRRGVFCSTTKNENDRSSEIKQLINAGHTASSCSTRVTITQQVTLAIPQQVAVAKQADAEQTDAEQTVTEQTVTEQEPAAKQAADTEQAQSIGNTPGRKSPARAVSRQEKAPRDHRQPRRPPKHTQAAGLERRTEEIRDRWGDVLHP